MLYNIFQLCYNFLAKLIFEVIIMMIEPSIDKLLDKTDNNRYVLCTLIAKRAKEIESIRRLELADQDKKAITIACEEIVEGKVKPSKLS